MPDRLVFVQGYYRSDGTYVDPHFRSYPQRSMYHNPDRPPYQGAKKYTPKEIREMQEEARRKLQELEPKLEEAMKRVEELKAKRAKASEAGDREKVKRINDRCNEVFENEYVPNNAPGASGRSSMIRRSGNRCPTLDQQTGAVSACLRRSGEGCRRLMLSGDHAMRTWPRHPLHGVG